MIDPNRKVWQNGWWPLDRQVEAYMKERILVAQPDAKFFYCEGFREECRQADRDARLKLKQETKIGK